MAGKRDHKIDGIKGCRGRRQSPISVHPWIQACLQEGKAGPPGAMA